MNIDLSKLSVNDAIEMYYNTLPCHNLEIDESEELFVRVACRNR